MREKWLAQAAIFLASPFFCSIPLSFPSNACYNTFVPLSGISDCSVYLVGRKRNVVILRIEETVVILTIEVRAKAARHDVRARQLAREILQLPIPGLPLPAAPPLSTALPAPPAVPDTSFSSVHLTGSSP